MSILLSNLLAGSYQGDKGQKGDTGAKGEQGSFGGASFDYTYDNSTANTAPATGYLAFNDTDLSTATALLINHTDGNSEDINSFIHTIDDSTSAIKGHFTVTEVANVANFAIFSIVGSLTEVSTYDYIPIAYLSGSTSFTDETPVTITLARTGDVGDKGAKGEVGDKGETGAKGNQGDVGQKGEVGATGDKGETGSKGDKGETGATGDKGDTGSKGETGSAGVKGDTGSKGDTGATGDKGTKGDTGAKGDTGSTGDKGDAGDKGDTGAKGEKGDTGATGDKGDTGDKGQKGQDGILGDYLYKTSTYTAAAKDIILADTSGGSFTITLPATPSAGEWVRISDGDNWGNNNLTIARNGSTIEGVSDDIVLDIGNLVAEFTYTGTTWLVTTTLGTKGDKGESGGIDLSSVTNTAILFADSGGANGSAAFTFDKDSNTVTISGTLVPGANVTYDLGTPTMAFKDLYLSGNTLNLDGVTLSASNGTLVLPESTKVGDVAITSPKIANVQIANSSWSALDDAALDTAGGYILINGSGFQTGCNVLLGSQAASSVTLANTSQLRVTVPALTSGSYTIYVTNPDGGLAIGLNGLATSNTPVWSTSATLDGNTAPASVSISLAATESSDTITYSNVGALPTGLTLAANGYLSGNLNPVATTTYNFTVRATDEENQDADRTFSITITVISTYLAFMNGGYDASNRCKFIPFSTASGGGKTIMTGQIMTACGAAGVQSTTVIISELNDNGEVVWSHNYGSSNTYAYPYNAVLGPTEGYTVDNALFGTNQLSFKQTIGPTKNLIVDSNGDAYTVFMASAYSGVASPNYLVKHYGNGSIAWQASIMAADGSNTSQNSAIYSIDLNSSGNTVMISGTWGAVLNINVASYQIAGYVHIDTSTGNKISTFKPTMEKTHRVIFDNDDNIVAVGTNYGGYGIYKANSTPGDGVINGIWGWRDYGGAGRFLTDVVCDSNNDVYALGCDSNTSSPKIAFLKVSGSNGAVQWHTSVANTSNGKWWIPGGVDVDSTGEFVYYCGTEASGSSGAAWNAYLFKIRCSNGQSVWTRRITGSNYIRLTDVRVDGTEVVVTGTGHEPYDATNTLLTYSGAVYRLPIDGTGTGSNIANTAVGYGGVIDGDINYETATLTFISPTLSPSACSSLGYTPIDSGSYKWNVTALSGTSVLYDETKGSRIALSNLTDANAFSESIPL